MPKGRRSCARCEHREESDKTCRYNPPVVIYMSQREGFSKFEFPPWPKKEWCSKFKFDTGTYEGD